MCVCVFVCACVFAYEYVYVFSLTVCTDAEQLRSQPKYVFHKVFIKYIEEVSKTKRAKLINIININIDRVFMINRTTLLSGYKTRK